MRGDGTKPANMSGSLAPARLLDLTRSLRRAGRMPTGIDRVERAYLEHLLADHVPLFGLVRTALGYLLLDGPGCQAFLDCLQGRTPWPAPDALSRMSRRAPKVGQAETVLRREAIARCLPQGLTRMLMRHLPLNSIYFNVGHSNLTDCVLKALNLAHMPINVLIHDVIPLDHPGYQRPETVEPFKRKMQRVSRFADWVIYNSTESRVQTEAHLGAWGRVPPAIVAHLGVAALQPDIAELPPGLLPDRPYFMVLGTIEPRKNHAFLLDLWRQLGADAPPLLICGSRGWNNQSVFDRLDTLTPNSPIRELPNLNDRTIAALLQHSAGLLFPSHAEGYGLPAIEALALGTRVLCNDLPVFHEVLGGFGNFVPVADSNSWLDIIKKWENEPTSSDTSLHFLAPTWADHFNTVLRLS